MSNELTVIVPFYNEEKYLEKSVKRLVEVNVAKKILLIDDNSTDNSQEIAKDLVNSYENIELYVKNVNEGKGSCVLFAKQFVTTSHVIVHDADLEYDPENLIPLFKLAQKNSDSLVLGSRNLGKIKRVKLNKILVFTNYIFSLFFSILNFYWVSDIATCYILMPTSFFKNFIFEEKGFCIEVEILSKYLKYKKKIIEYPISYIGRSYSDGKKIKLSDGVKIFIKIFKYSKFFNSIKFFRSDKP